MSNPDNYVHFFGHLTRDPEYFEPHDDKQQRVKFTLAVSKGKESAYFFNCVAFGKAADIISTYYRKGTGCDITGELHNDQYTDKEGNKRDYYCIYVDGFKIRTQKKNDENGSGEVFKGFEAVDVDVPF